MNLAVPNSNTTNVKVAVRIRPLSSKERVSGSTECISTVLGVPQIVAGPDRSFTFDSVFAGDCRQLDVFEELVAPLLDSYFDGFNCTILAYGQTGSGKTFTMGTGIDGNFDHITQGIVPRAIELILDRLSMACNESWDIYVSFLEIYNEEIIDLLSPLSVSGKRHTLSIREDASREIFLAGIKEEHVQTAAQLKRTNASGDRAKESISINSGLLALGNVISALGDESKHAAHIPYRDSKLTRMLQDSLGGNSKTLMIACVSPSTDNFNETLNTLKYANRARNIKNRVEINQDANGNAAFEIIQLKKQVSALKQELLMARSAMCQSGPKRTIDNGNNDELAKQNADLLKRLELLAKEKVHIEAERDYLRSIHGAVHDSEKVSAIKQHLSTIQELKAKLAQYENPRKRSYQARSSPKSPRSPQPEWLVKSTMLVERARNDISEKLNLVSTIRAELIPEDTSTAQFAAAVETRVESLLGPLKDDLGLREELAQSLHKLQQEYQVMQQKYTEKIKMLHDQLQREQHSQAIHQPSTQPTQPHNSDRILRVKYEDKIKQMGREINELKERLESQSRNSNTRTSTSDALLRSLKQTVQQLKAEKSKLLSQLNDDASAARTRRQNATTEMSAELVEARGRERKAMEAAKKWHKAYDFQKALLQKRIEQCFMARSKIKFLLQTLRRHRVRLDSPGQGFDTPGWRQLLKTPSASASASRCHNGDDRMDIVMSPCIAGNQSMDLELDSVLRLSKFASNEDLRLPPIMSRLASVSNTPRSRLAYGWVPTERPPQVSPERPKPRDFFAQIADAASLSLRASASNPFVDKK